MLVGTPKEIKQDEFRVGMVPSAVRELVARGHDVVVETSAGAGIGVADEDYERVGARIAPDAQTVFATADMVVKVKEPQPDECRMLRPGPGAVHLPASRAGSGTGAVVAGVAMRRDRL